MAPTCGIGKKLYKMAGHSASKPLKSTSIELSCINCVGRGTMHSRDTQHQIGTNNFAYTV